MRKRLWGTRVRAIIPRPNKAPRCVQKRLRISHAKLQPPFAFTITLSLPISNPLTDYPYIRIDGPRKRSHLNANNALIVRATRGCSHKKQDPPCPFFLLPLVYRHAFLSTCTLCRTLRLPLFTTLPLLPRYNLCPRAMSFRDIIMPYRNVTSRSSLSSRNSRRRAATTYDDHRCHDMGGYSGKGNHLIFMSSGRDPFLRTTLHSEGC